MPWTKIVDFPDRIPNAGTKTGGHCRGVASGNGRYYYSYWFPSQSGVSESYFIIEFFNGTHKSITVSSATSFVSYGISFFNRSVRGVDNSYLLYLTNYSPINIFNLDINSLSGITSNPVRVLKFCDYYNGAYYFLGSNSSRDSLLWIFTLRLSSITSFTISSETIPSEIAGGYGIKFDSNGNLWAIDSNNKLRKRTGSSWDTGIDIPFDSYGLTINGDGNFVVSDRATGLFEYTEPEPDRPRTWNRLQTAPYDATGVTINPTNGFIAVTDNRGVVSESRSDGNWHAISTQRGSTTGVQGVFIDQDNRIHVVDSQSDRWHIYDGVWSVGLPIPSGEITPKGIYVTGRGIAARATIVGTATDRVYTSRLTSWDSGIALPTGVTAPEGVAIDGHGRIIVVDATTRKLYIHDGSGWDSGLDLPIANPRGVATDRSGNLYVVFQNREIHGYRLSSPDIAVVDPVPARDEPFTQVLIPTRKNFHLAAFPSEVNLCVVDQNLRFFDPKRSIVTSRYSLSQFERRYNPRLRGSMLIGEIDDTSIVAKLEAWVALMRNYNSMSKIPLMRPTFSIPLRPGGFFITAKVTTDNSFEYSTDIDLTEFLKVGYYVHIEGKTYQVISRRTNTSFELFPDSDLRVGTVVQPAPTVDVALDFDNDVEMPRVPDWYGPWTIPWIELR